MDRADRTLLAVLALAALLPVWQSGDRKGLTFYHFIWLHTIWAGSPMYVPAEYDALGSLLPVVRWQEGPRLRRYSL